MCPTVTVASPSSGPPYHPDPHHEYDPRLLNTSTARCHDPHDQKEYPSPLQRDVVGAASRRLPPQSQGVRLSLACNPDRPTNDQPRLTPYARHQISSSTFTCSSRVLEKDLRLRRSHPP